MNLYDNIRSQLTNKQVARHYLGEPHQYSGNNIGYRSPFRNEKHPSFWVNDEKGFTDFGAKEHSGNMITFVMQYKNLSSYYDAAKQIINDFGLNIEIKEDMSCYIKNKAKEKVEEFYEWKNSMIKDWQGISISSPVINDEVSMNAGDTLDLTCTVSLGAIPPSSVTVEVFYGKFVNGEKLSNSIFKEMELSQDLDNNTYEYKTTLAIDNGGNYGYTFRVLPKHDMMINKQDMSLVKWIEY